MSLVRHAGLPTAEELILEHEDNLSRKIMQKVRQKAPGVHDPEELKSLARYGLVQAADRWNAYCIAHQYDPWALSYFRTYAMLRMEGAILDRLRQTDHLTRSQRQVMNAIKAAGWDQGATVQEVQQATGLARQLIEETLLANDNKTVNLEEAESVAVSDALDELEFGPNLLSAMDKSFTDQSPICQTILALHYYEERELREIAKMLGITESKASHYHTEAVLMIFNSIRDTALASEAGQYYARAVSYAA